MTDFTLTPEQEAILAEAKAPENLIINALAGAAKTSTLCLLAKKLPLVPTLSCCFNKSIAVEMQKRMPSHVSCKTMNALGHAAWGQKLGKRLSVETDKGYSILMEISNAVRPEQKKRMGEAFSSLLRAVRLAKSNGYVPPRCRTLGRSLIETEEFLDQIGPDLDVEPDEEFAGWMIEALERSIAQAFEGRIDFDDQIYMSVLFGAQYPKFPIILVDEAQDLSPLNHEALRLMFGGRLIAVGDPFQAIYAFRGAHIGSMQLLKEEFKMKELTLSVSFRCPRAVVERARFRATHMQYPEWAKPGHVEKLYEWGPSSIPDGAFILCRNNAPLFSVALRLIRAGRGVELSRGDIGKNLVGILKKFGDPKMPHESVLGEISRWETAQLEKARESRRSAIYDKAECLRVFANAGSTLTESIAFAEHLFASTGSVKLMTGHKAKGLETEVVFHLDPFLIPSKFALRAAEEGDNSKLEQERNLRYVIESRSRDSLFLVDSDDFDPLL